MGSMKRVHFLDVVTMTGVPAQAEAVCLDRGFDLRWSILETPFGAALAAASSLGLCAFEFLGEDGRSSTAARKSILANLATRWGDANLVADNPTALDSAKLASAFEAVGSDGPLAGSRHPLPLHLRGTAFQIAVWQKLLTIPSGRLVTYGDLAGSLGKPNAARAVGSAVGANSIALFVPCHRVVAASGSLGGYRWGTSLKQALIDRELPASGKGQRG